MWWLKLVQVIYRLQQVDKVRSAIIAVLSRSTGSNLRYIVHEEQKKMATNANERPLAPVIHLLWQLPTELCKCDQGNMGTCIKPSVSS
jgi:hypothetical protein